MAAEVQVLVLHLERMELVLRIQLANTPGSLRLKERIIFFSRGAGATPEPTPNNMSPRQMVQRLKKNAQNVKTISKSEKARALKDYKKDRKEVDKFLNQAYVSDRTFVKGSRSDRITNRANKRK